MNKAVTSLSPLHNALAKKILVVDGAMGTMIQAAKLEEADYRGERFADHKGDLKGNNDLLSLTRPELIAEAIACSQLLWDRHLRTNVYLVWAVAILGQAVFKQS